MAGEAVLSIVLEGFLSKLSSPILDEFGLLWGVKKEKQKLQSSLSRIEAVLQDAERQQIDLMADKDRIGKLKDVAYDAEDLVDEFLVEALRRKVENQDGMGRKVGNFFSPANPLAFRFKIAHKMKELRERFEELAGENNNFQSAEGVARIQPQIPNPRDTASSVPVWGVYGRDYQKENYIDSLINSGNEEVLSVIPIVGMGGLGKTTLAQYVYDDERVVTHFNLKMWVYVSEDFDVGRILARILQSATNKSTPTDGSSMDLLNTRVKENLSGKRYLLVLDDVWNEDSEKWDRLRTALQCAAKGSKVLVTTRSDTVARRMDALPRPPLATLSPVESWTLFEKVAHPPTGFVSIGEEIVRKCGGVPLAIKTLGGMLRNETSEREWQSVRDSELWKRTDNEGGILSIIRLSYDHLTSSLKQCFAYCAVIPKGHRFNKDELIKQWIAQGFIHSDDENELLEEEGEKYFNALLRRSLFQVDVETAGNDTYKMHDLIHDLLKSVAGKECLVVEASMMNDLTRLLALCNDETRHLSLCNDERAGDPKNLDALKKCKKLRSMITYGYYRCIDINVCLSFGCLRVLDLSWRRSIHFLPNSIDKLRHLRYFDISHTWIKELPETICNLHNLQTLRVFGILLKKWPKNMKRMISLRHIEFSGDGGGDFLLPKGIGELTCLRTLSKFVINKESEPGMEELKDLNQLMGDISIEGLENTRNGACAREADLKAKKHLHSLHLRWNRPPYVSDRNAQEVINNLEPHSNLKKLLVSNYIGLSFPSWMMMLSNLIHIELRGCIRCEQLPPFGQLPLLESLEIYEMSAIKYIVKFDGSHNNKDIFRSLRCLVLNGLSNLERWSSPQENGDGDEQRREEDEQVILGRLSRLDIVDCPNLIRLPKLLLPALERLSMHGVRCDRIDLPMSKSLKGVSLTSMPNLEMWSSREADDDQKVIYPLLELDVRNCPKMVRLPHLLPSLKELIIVETDERLLGSLANYTSLVRLDIEGFPEVMHLPEEIGPTHANNLHSWKIADCPKLISISHQLKYLHSLEELRIYKCPELVLQSLDGSQEQQPCPPLNSLKKLEIWESCERQRLLPGEGMKITKCGNLESLFSKGLQNLTTLYIKECPKVWSSPEWLRSLTSLKKLTGVVLDAMTSLTNPLENLKSLEDLSISSGPDMTDFPEWIGNLASLTDLLIIDCPSIRSLPESLGNLASLTVLRIRDCPSIRSLPESLGNLASLAYLWITDCPSTRSLPESLGNLASLTYLWIEDCPSIRSLPESLGNLQSLSDMTINSCQALTELPKGLQRLTNLQELSIWKCPDLERRLRKNWKEWKKVAHVPEITIDYRAYSWEAEHPSLMQSLKKGCNEFDKKLHFPTCASSSSP